ncbi:MAG TPA: class I SAM-dependent methyltransferase [Candidatus Elarobacter sp.]
MGEPPAAVATFSYDLIAGIYDEDMGRNVGGDDVAFYVGRCAEAGGPVLELGCGTGRITLPLVRAGLSVTGIDLSGPMLQRLRAKAASLTPAEQARLELRCADMAEVDLARRFARVICPYSAFTYLVEPERRARALARVREHLAPDGRFILDVFVPDGRIEALPPGHVHHDYRRTLGDGSILERTKTVTPAEPGVNAIAREYTFLDQGGALLKRVRTLDRIRVYEPDALRTVLEAHGFRVVEGLPDFGAGPWTGATKMAAFICSAA